MSRLGRPVTRPKTLAPKVFDLPILLLRQAFEPQTPKANIDKQIRQGFPVSGHPRLVRRPRQNENMRTSRASREFQLCKVWTRRRARFHSLQLFLEFRFACTLTEDTRMSFDSSAHTSSGRMVGNPEV